MIQHYPDGSFMLSWDQACAWYDANGNLLDCKKKYTLMGLPVRRAIPQSHKHVRAYLEQQGKLVADLIKHGILKVNIEVLHDENT